MNRNRMGETGYAFSRSLRSAPPSHPTPWWKDNRYWMVMLLTISLIANVVVLADLVYLYATAGIRH